MSKSKISQLFWIIAILFAILLSIFPNFFPAAVNFPQHLTLPLGDWISNIVEVSAVALKTVSRVISSILEVPMLAIRDSLQWLPWISIILLSVTITLYSGASLWVLIIVITSLLYVVATGYWYATMNTLALVALAVPLSLFVGLILGILTHRSRWVRPVMIPLLDLMQTMPTFAYLIPILFLFGFGPVVGLISSAIFAIPPMVRNVILGLENISTDILDAGHISGTSKRQQLFLVELPAAVTQLRMGVNQTIMATLSMVIIAAIIGGFDDIGWEVLSNMRKARFGDSLLSGIVIVLIAIILDRVSLAFVTRSTGDLEQLKSRKLFSKIFLFISMLSVIYGKIIELEAPLLDSVHWIKSLSQFIDIKLETFVANYGDILTEIKDNTFYYYLLPVRIGISQAVLPYTWGFNLTITMKWGYLVVSSLLVIMFYWKRKYSYAIGLIISSYLLYFGIVGAPWLSILLILLVASWRIAGYQVAVFVASVGGLLLITNLWEKAMLSIYLCGSAAILAFLLGAGLGTLAAISDRFSHVLRPVLDTFQTIPMFVFLIPFLMLFQIGEFTALLAIIAYAFVPAARYTENGLRQVSHALIDAAKMQGCSEFQLLLKVKIPIAFPTILLGLNQTLLFAFSMLVITALVGTTGLGQQVYIALTAADVGAGLIAGSSMAFLAMIADRLLKARANQLQRQTTKEY